MCCGLLQVWNHSIPGGDEEERNGGSGLTLSIRGKEVGIVMQEGDEHEVKKITVLHGPQFLAVIVVPVIEQPLLVVDHGTGVQWQGPLASQHHSLRSGLPKPI